MGRLFFKSFSELTNWSVADLCVQSISSSFPVVAITPYLRRVKEKITVENSKEYMQVTVRVRGNGVVKRCVQSGSLIATKQQFVAHTGQLIVSKIDARNGAVGIIPKQLNAAIVSGDFMLFEVDNNNLCSEFLSLVLTSEQFRMHLQAKSSGTTNRQRITEADILNGKIPLPPIAEQRKILDEYNRLKLCAKNAENAAFEIEERIENLLYDRLEIHNIALDSKNAGRILKTWRFSKLKEWDVAKRNSSITPDELFNSYKYNCKLITEMCSVNPTTSLSELGNKDVSFIPMECVCKKSGTIKEYRAEKASKSAGYTRFKDNDVLWAKITPCMQNGKCTVAKGLKNGYGFGSTEFNVFRVNPDELLPEYLHLFLRSKRLRSLAQDYFTGSSGQQRVSSKFFESLKIPVIAISSSNPSEITQEKIVKEAHDLRDKWAKKIEEAKELKAQADKYFESAVFE